MDMTSYVIAFTTAVFVGHLLGKKFGVSRFAATCGIIFTLVYLFGTCQSYELTHQFAIRPVIEQKMGNPPALPGRQ